MSQAQRIIDRLGGTRKAAVVLTKPPSTVQSWKVSGFVPARCQAEVIEKARQAGIKLEPADFFDVAAA